MNPRYIKKKFLETLSFAESNKNIFVKNPHTDFSRNRKCSFSDLLMCIFLMEAHSLNSEIRKFFASVNKPAPSKSAFCQQRAKLNGEIFPFIFHTMNRQFPCTSRFRGFHLVACDGSDINIHDHNNDPDTRIRSNTKGVVYHQMHLNAFYDILDNRYVDLLLQPGAKSNERSAFKEMFLRSSLPKKTIFVVDRGYPSVDLIAFLLEQKAFFVMRTKDIASKNSFLGKMPFPDSECFDIQVHVNVTRSRSRKYLNDTGKYICLGKKNIFSPIPSEDHETLYPLRFRVVRFLLPEGHTECLITNLPEDRFDPEALKGIYALRWSIETSFLYLKYILGMTSFHCKKREFILQEIYARAIMFNLMTMMVVKLKPLSTEQYQYKISFADAIVTVRAFLIHRIKNEEIKKVLLRYRTPIRPNRKYTRKIRSKRVVSLNNRT